MKNNLLLLLLLASVSLAGCKKENPSPLVGEWELATSNGGFTGKQTTYPRGNGSILKFSNNSYESSNNGTVTRSGVYSIQKSNTSIVNRVANKLLYDNDPNSIWFFTIEKDELSLFMDAYDGPSLSYRKK